MADNSNRGFASMDDQKQRAIASQGGKAAHESGNAHEFSPDEARKAGRKGGETVSQDRGHMAEIGSEGGKASHGGNAGGRSGSSTSAATQGGSTEQHREAGRQSHKNS
jgi:uncharacterized protein